MTSEDMDCLNSRLLEDGTVEKDTVTLTSTNAAADRINAPSILKSCLENPVQYAASIRGEFDEGSSPARAALQVKVGAQVMAMLRNDPNGHWVNGDVGTVEQM